MSKVAFGRQVDETDLAGIRDKILQINADQFDKLQERAKINFGRTLTLVKEFSGLDAALSLVNSVALPIHDESPTHFSYSMFMRVVVSAGDRRGAEVSSAVTCTVMIVRSRVITIIMAAEAEQLESERAIQKELVTEIRRANQ